MRASLFGNLRSGANSTAGSPISTPAASHKSSATDDVEPLSLPPSAAPASTSTNPPISAPRARPLTRLTPFGRKSSPSREGLPLGPPPITNTSTTPTASPSLPPSSPSLGATGGVSYLDSLGLRLGEAVSKALILPVASSSHPAPSAAGVKVVPGAPGASGAKVGAVAGGISEGPDAVLKGKRPLPAGRGRALGALITSELNHASTALQDSFLHRAILRLLQRPLTVLTTNLTQQVTQLLLAPEFVPTVPLVLNATHVHALAYAHFASELLETFDVLGLGRRAGAGNDGLRPLKEALENVVSKVIGPLVGALKTEVSGVVSELEKETPVSPSPLATTGVDQKFDRTVTRVAPLLARVTFSTDGTQTQSTHVQSVLATFEIGVIWGCLVALSNRMLPRCSSVKADEDEKVGLRRTMSEGRLRTQPSDSSLGSAESDESAKTDYLGGDKEKGRGMLPSYVTPPDTPQMAPVGAPTLTKKSSTKSPVLSSGLSLVSLTQWSSPAGSPRATSPKQITPPGSKKLSLVKLPSLKPLSSGTRAPSPPMVKVAAASPSSPLRPRQAPDDAFSQVYKPFVLALHALTRDAKTVQTSVKKLRLPVEAGGLAHDAVEEALKELNGFVAFLEWLVSPDSGSSALLVDARDADVDVEKVMKKTREAPLLLVLPVILRVALVPICAKGAAGPNGVPQDTVSAWIGLPEDEYRRSCLGGFGKADECASIVGKAVLKNGGARRLFCGWMREWLERSVKEEEESSSSDEEED